MLEPLGTRIEWRSRSEGDDVIIAVDDASNEVLRAWNADPALLTDFLNDMTELSEGDNAGFAPSAQNWGALVIARTPEGDVVDVDPQLYWEGISYWFRSRGEDPHAWHRPRT